MDYMKTMQVSPISIVPMDLINKLFTRANDSSESVDPIKSKKILESTFQNT